MDVREGDRVSCYISWGCRGMCLGRGWDGWEGLSKPMSCGWSAPCKNWQGSKDREMAWGGITLKVAEILKYDVLDAEDVRTIENLPSLLVNVVLPPLLCVELSPVPPLCPAVLLLHPFSFPFGNKGKIAVAF